jgi:hypothetical protein
MWLASTSAPPPSCCIVGETLGRWQPRLSSGIGVAGVALGSSAASCVNLEGAVDSIKKAIEEAGA